MCYYYVGDSMENKIVIGGIYRHFKGNLYKVLEMALDSETLEEIVVYKALYGEEKTWVRPKKMFLEEVNRNDQKYRFELIG